MGGYLQGEVTVTELGFYNEIMTMSVICSELLIFWGATNLVWQCMFISWSVLWKDCFAVFKVKVTVKVLNFSKRLPGQYLWLVKLSMVMYHHQPEYHSEISFCDVQGQSHSCFDYSTRSSEVLKLLQSKLVWWYIITRQSKTLWTDFLA